MRSNPRRRAFLLALSTLASCASMSAPARCGKRQRDIADADLRYYQRKHGISDVEVTKSSTWGSSGLFGIEGDDVCAGPSDGLPASHYAADADGAACRAPSASPPAIATPEVSAHPLGELGPPAIVRAMPGTSGIPRGRGSIPSRRQTGPEWNLVR